MARTISLVLLISLIIALAITFIFVMQQFLLPLFLAVLLVVVFRPMHQWMLRKTGDRKATAAALTTIGIVAVVLLPVLAVIGQATLEGLAVVQETNPQQVASTLGVRAKKLSELARKYATRVGVTVPDDEELVQQSVESLRGSIAPLAMQTGQAVVGLVFGMFIMVTAVYFFLLDGQEMIESGIRLIPMDNRYLSQMIGEFDRVSRAVVTATLLSSLAQGLLAGFSYLVTGVPHLFLLTAATTVLTLVPFVGSAIIWGGAAAWLFFFENRTGAAIFVLLWGSLVVSTVDNFIKPAVLKGQSNLHPLLALLSVIGGVQTLGLIGAFVGPMIVAFLQAALNLLRKELRAADAPTSPPPVIG